MATKEKTEGGFGSEWLQVSAFFLCQPCGWWEPLLCLFMMAALYSVNTLLQLSLSWEYKINQGSSGIFLDQSSTEGQSDYEFSAIYWLLANS